MVETIFTKHPQKGKAGREISKQKYDTIRAALTEVLTVKGALTHTELLKAVEERLQKTPFPGNVGWYAETVKLDLEARKIIRRLPGKPEKYEIWPDIKL